MCLSCEAEVPLLSGLLRIPQSSLGCRSAAGVHWMVPPSPAPPLPPPPPPPLSQISDTHLSLSLSSSHTHTHLSFSLSLFITHTYLHHTHIKKHHTHTHTHTHTDPPLSLSFCVCLGVRSFFPRLLCCLLSNPTIKHSCLGSKQLALNPREQSSLQWLQPGDQ